MNYLKSLKFLKLAGLLGLISACAAQSTYRELSDAQAIYNKAQSLAPNDPRVEKAKVRLESGDRNLSEARFGRASKDFQEVTRLSNKVLQEKDPETIEAARKKEEQMYQEKGLAQLEAEASLSPSSSSQRASQESSEPSPEELSRMSLPAQALAQYLSRKNSARKEKPTPPAPPPPKPKAKIEKMEVKGTASTEVGDDIDVAEKTIVTASAVKESKADPVLNAEKEKTASKAAIQAKAMSGQNEKAIEPPVPELDGDEYASAKSFEPPRRRYPKDIQFQDADVSLLTAEMDKLDEIGRYLIENPSNSLVLAGFITKAESPSLIEQRFQAVRAYLSTRGVPEDQVKLDPPRKVGPQAAFELYLIDH